MKIVNLARLFGPKRPKSINSYINEDIYGQSLKLMQDRN